MKMVAGKNRRSVVGKDIYVGIDVHKESWQITVRTGGEEIFNGRIPGQYQPLKKFLERYQDCRTKVAYEAGPFGFWLSDKLIGDGIETLVVPPSLIPTESGNRVKTDRKDSRKLATLLESNMLKRVYVLTPEERGAPGSFKDSPADRRPPE
jgi:transposase